MKKEQIQLILQNALEEKIPSSQFQLWRSVEAYLAEGKSPLGQHTKNIKPQYKHAFLFAVLTIVILLGAIFATPQGRTFAQNIFQFFVDPSAPTIEPPELVSIAEAEAQIGFDVVKLADIPDGFSYLGARLSGNTVSIEYEAQDGAGELIIQQSQEGIYQSDWDKIPADVILLVKIGELDGEFVQGTFVIHPGDTFATWNPDAPMARLRWLKDGIWFKIIKFGEEGAIEYLDQASMIELAESLINEP